MTTNNFDEDYYLEEIESGPVYADIDPETGEEIITKAARDKWKTAETEMQRALLAACCIKSMKWSTKADKSRFKQVERLTFGSSGEAAQMKIWLEFCIAHAAKTNAGMFVPRLPLSNVISWMHNEAKRTTYLAQNAQKNRAKAQSGSQEEMEGGF